MKADLQRVTASKNAMRRNLAKRPFAEKVSLLEELSERALATRKDTSLPLPHEPWSVPSHWHWSTMGEVSEIVGGGTPKTDRPEYFGGAVPWITPADLSGYRAKTISRGSRNITEEGLAHSGARLMPSGTVLFSSRAPIGYVAIAANPVATNQGFKSFVLKPNLDSNFVYYYLQRAKPMAAALASGTTFLEISGKNAARLPIPVPPLTEQRTIVAEIEKQFTRLDAGVAALKRVQANLKRYRASVLKAACEGRLVPTEAELARAEGRSYEPADQLLARILTERRKKWSGRGKYKETAPPNTTKLGKLSEGWKWSTLDALAEIKGGITKDQGRKFSVPTRSVPYLRVANVQRGYLDLGEMKKIVTTEDEIQELALKPGDILFNEGGDRDKLGRGWIWKSELPECIHQNHVFRARLFVDSLNPKLVSWYANTFGQKFFFDEGKHTTNLASISMTKLKGLPVPVPPATEQTRIVAEVERRLSAIDQLQATVIDNFQRSTRLRQSILQAAFSQNPH
jgi:type I restriction enzyme S subunit